MKFILLVEGQTERNSAAAFLKRWLDPQLRQPVGIQTVTFDGYAELLRKMATKARMHLEGPKESEIIGVIALLDLYGPTFYPSDKTTADERFAWAKEQFERQVSLDRFRMFFAVHEFEAWLLSQTAIFPAGISIALQDKSAHPERVNFDEPPAKLLDRLYKQHTKRNYKKTTYGRQLFARLDPTVAMSRCPKLGALLVEMLAMARSAGLGRAEYDLRLMFWGDGTGVPATGSRLVIIGIDNSDLLHIRILGASGNLETDTDQTRLPAERNAAIASLKQRVSRLLPPHAVTAAEKEQVVEEVRSIVGRIGPVI